MTVVDGNFEAVAADEKQSLGHNALVKMGKRMSKDLQIDELKGTLSEVQDQLSIANIETRTLREELQREREHLKTIEQLIGLVRNR